MPEIGARRTSTRTDGSSESLLYFHEQMLPAFKAAAEDEARPIFENTFRIDNRETVVAEQAMSVYGSYAVLHVVDVSACFEANSEIAIQNISSAKENPNEKLLGFSSGFVGKHVSFNSEWSRDQELPIPSISFIAYEDGSSEILKSRVELPTRISRTAPKTVQPELLQAVELSTAKKIGKLSLARMVEKNLVENVSDRVAEIYSNTPFNFAVDSSGYSRFHRPLRTRSDFFNLMMIGAGIDKRYEDMMRMSGNFDDELLLIMKKTMAFLDKNYKGIKDATFVDVCRYWENPSPDAVGALGFMYPDFKAGKDTQLSAEDAEVMVIKAAQDWQRQGTPKEILNNLNRSMPDYISYNTFMSHLKGRHR